MTSNFVVFILLFSLISKSLCLNALFISVSGAGHVTPMFELAKAMKNHNITFLTHQSAQVYIDLKSYSSSSLHIIYANDSPDALLEEMNREQQAMTHLSNQSMLDAFPSMIPLFVQMTVSLLNKTIHILTFERFDVIVADTMIFGVPVLCKKVNTPCVIQSASLMPSMLDLNLPNPFSFLTSTDLTHITQRIYNVAFSMRLMIKLVPKFVPILYPLFQTLPQIPGPFHDTFTLKNLLFSKSKCSQLVSVPSSFYAPSYSHHYTKYLGAFVDETFVDHVDNDLTRWIKSKPPSSIVYGAFGSSSVILHDRMYHLMNGLAKFLLQTDDSCLLLVFRSTNYDTYQAVLKDLYNDEFREVLNNIRRVRIESAFVPQKWILQQNSVNIFLSHCGMGSSLEGLYFSKPILCMPFNMEQFSNAIAIKNLDVGQSLFVPPSALQSLIHPYDVVRYTFTADSVTEKTSILWMNASYKKAARLMSLEMKNEGGLKRAVEEIEFFVNLDGDLDRFAPFQSTLAFYQRYILDLLLIFVVVPGVIIAYILSKCCKRRRKEKIE